MRSDRDRDSGRTIAHGRMQSDGVIKVSHNSALPAAVAAGFSNSGIRSVERVIGKMPWLPNCGAHRTKSHSAVFFIHCKLLVIQEIGNRQLFGRNSFSQFDTAVEVMAGNIVN